MTPEVYWDLDDQHRDQKFYTAFCLLGAACNDYAIGIDLAAENKLNWAAAALYYSLMHCGRLACFIAYGDFPYTHERLHALFEEVEVSGKSWMVAFKPFLGVGSDVAPQRTFRRDYLVSCFATSSELSSDVQGRLTKWGQMLSSAKKLRENSNYDELLITHAHNHVTVTEAFERLVRAFSLASRTVLAEAIPLMKAFVDASDRQEHWYAFLNWKQEREGLYYLEDSLTKMNQQALLRLEDSLSSLRKTPDQPLDLAGEVRGNIKVGVFPGKTSLMNWFQSKLEEFERMVESIAL